MPYEGFWRTWDGRFFYILNFDPSKQIASVVFPGKENEIVEIPEEDFGKKVEMMSGDMTPTFMDEYHYVPAFRKIVGFEFLRHSGDSSYVNLKLEKI